MGEHMSNDREYLLQILDKKRISYNNVVSYRLLVSDGQYQYSSTVLATHLNHLVRSGELGELSVICVSKYTTRLLQSGYVSLLYIFCLLFGSIRAQFLYFLLISLRKSKLGVVFNDVKVIKQSKTIKRLGKPMHLEQANFKHKSKNETAAKKCTAEEIEEKRLQALERLKKTRLAKLKVKCTPEEIEEKRQQAIVRLKRTKEKIMKKM